jgi:hypothetical protein
LLLGCKVGSISSARTAYQFDPERVLD